VADSHNDYVVGKAMGPDHRRWKKESYPWCKSAPPMREFQGGGSTQWYDGTETLTDWRVFESGPGQSVPKREDRTKSGGYSGKFKRCQWVPLSNGPYPRKVLYLRQLAGPPRFSLPWYDAAPPYGKKVSDGWCAEARLGPVVRYVTTTASGEGKRWIPGFVSCSFRNPYYVSGEKPTCRLDKSDWYDPNPGGDGGCMSTPWSYDRHESNWPSQLQPEFVWVNIYCSHNVSGEKTGVAYCDLQWESGAPEEFLEAEHTASGTIFGNAP